MKRSKCRVKYSHCRILCFHYSKCNEVRTHLEHILLSAWSHFKASGASYAEWNLWALCSGWKHQLQVGLFQSGWKLKPCHFFWDSTGTRKKSLKQNKGLSAGSNYIWRIQRNWSDTSLKEWICFNFKHKFKNCH